MSHVDQTKTLERLLNPESQARKRANQVIEILKPFSRGMYNSGNMMESRFQQALINSQPIQVVGFCGANDKRSLDMADLLLLDEYRMIRQLITAITTSQAEITIILADAHGRFNGFKDFEGYHSRIDYEAGKRKLATVRLDQLYEQWGISLPEISEPIDEYLWNQFSQLKQSSQLIESASKHNKNGNKPEVSAFYYWIMRQQEAEPLKQTFSNAVLFINGSRDLGMATLPRNMPHVYSRFGPAWFQ